MRSDGDWLGIAKDEVRKYSDDQARDDSGKWSAEGPHRHQGVGYDSPAAARAGFGRELHTHGKFIGESTPPKLGHVHTTTGRMVQMGSNRYGHAGLFGDGGHVIKNAIDGVRWTGDWIGKYSEDQARDDGGKWTSSGAEGPHGLGPDKAHAHVEAGYARSHGNVRQVGELHGHVSGDHGVKNADGMSVGDLAHAHSDAHYQKPEIMGGKRDITPAVGKAIALANHNALTIAGVKMPAHDAWQGGLKGLTTSHGSTDLSVRDAGTHLDHHITVDMNDNGIRNEWHGEGGNYNRPTHGDEAKLVPAIRQAFVGQGYKVHSIQDSGHGNGTIDYNVLTDKKGVPAK